MGGHREQEGVGEGQGVVEVGAQGMRGSRTGGSVEGGRGSSSWVDHGPPGRRLLNVLLQLLQVALVLGATVLEPTNHLRKKKESKVCLI